MQKPVLISVPVPVISTVPTKVSWSFILYLYLELTVPQVRDCCPLGRLVSEMFLSRSSTKNMMFVEIPHFGSLP